ncbi:MAG: hypothetical protein ACYSUK_00635 [Planctomycetota bacterium]|jgi:hypothetical protein
MKKKLLLTLYLCFVLFVVSCEDMDVAQRESEMQLINTKLVTSYNDMAIENAIITQHTLYPYHFIQNGQELNELGFRDFGVLAGHFIENPGTLNIRQDYSVSDDLYERRVGHIQEMLEEAGVDSDRINIEDGMPGGSGVTSERVLLILENTKESLATTDTSSASWSSSGSSSGRSTSGGSR